MFWYWLQYLNELSAVLGLSLNIKGHSVVNLPVSSQPNLLFNYTLVWSPLFAVFSAQGCQSSTCFSAVKKLISFLSIIIWKWKINLFILIQKPLFISILPYSRRSLRELNQTYRETIGTINLKVLIQQRGHVGQDKMISVQETYCRVVSIQTSSESLSFSKCPWNLLSWNL